MIGEMPHAYAHIVYFSKPMITLTHALKFATQARPRHLF